jgi:hypothetical protein
MIENLIIMVRMICFSYELSKESGYTFDLEQSKGISPQEAMAQLFGPQIGKLV